MKTASHPGDRALGPDLWAEPDDRADLKRLELGLRDVNPRFDLRLRVP